MAETEFSLGGVAGKSSVLSGLYILLLGSILLFFSSFIGIVYVQEVIIIGLLFVGTIVGAIGFMFSAGGVMLFSD